MSMTAATQHAETAGDPGPTVFVLFGATGDLARRMVLPAFYRLAHEGLLPGQWRLVGNGRGDVAHEDFRAHFRDALTESGTEPDPQEWNAFAERVFFAGGGFSADDPGSLLDVIGKARGSLGGDPQLVHYLAVPPVAFAELTQALGQHGLARGARVVYEKPFGTSGDDFRELDRVVHSVLDEQQVYRIDHFLGKEATQDLHLLRFANESTAAFWNRRHVESVQIDVPETLDISDRAQFYDATGAVLDMLVTHLFQVAAEVAMEPPASLGAVGQPDPARAARAAQRPVAARCERALLLPRGRRRDRPLRGGQEAGPGAQPRRGAREHPAGQPVRRGSAAAVRPADPRCASRRPLAVYPPGRARRGMGRGRAPAVQAAPGQPLRARVVGTRQGRGTRRAWTLASRPVGAGGE